MHRVRLLIHGRVQGVGFRHFVLRRARELGLDGMVRNCPDDTVEVEAEGEAAKLRELVETVREGPPGARVSRIEDTWSEDAPHHQGFKIGI